MWIPVEGPPQEELPRSLREVRLVLVGLQGLVDHGLEPSGPTFQVSLKETFSVAIKLQESCQVHFFKIGSECLRFFSFFSFTQ